MMMMVIGVSQSCFNSSNKLLQNPTTSVSDSLRRRITAKTEIEIRVCVNRSCSRQGSRETLETLSGLAPSNISINSCGCLGRCGAGPNLVILPEEIFISHCGTATRVANVISRVCGGSEADSCKNLTALALRKRAEEELEMKNFSEAELLLSQAIDLKPSGGVHLIYRSRVKLKEVDGLVVLDYTSEEYNSFIYKMVLTRRKRSSARLAMGNNPGALEDAKEALTVAPQYPQAYLCRGDAFLAMGEFDAAEQSYASALQIDPSIRRSRSFKARIAKLQEKLTAADLPP